VNELAVAAIVLLAAFTQGAIGFGFGLVAMGILPLVVDELVAIPMVAVYSLLVAGMIAWRERHFLSWRRLAPPLVGVLLGVPVGLLFLAQADPKYIRLALGVFLVLYCLWSLLVSLRAGQRAVEDGWGYVAGLASGVLGGAFNTGGPPLVVYATLKNWDKDAATSTLQVLFAITSVIAIGGHIAADRMTEDVVRIILILLPVVGLGVWLGGRVYNRIDQATFRKGMLALLFVAGLVFINKSLHLV
jgi:hypothetical protein